MSEQISRSPGRPGKQSGQPARLAIMDVASSSDPNKPKPSVLTDEDTERGVLRLQR